MKIYNNCPVCKKESKIEIKLKIPVNSGDELSDIENDEIFFKLTNHQENKGLLSICMNCRLVYKKKFFDNDEIGYIYTKGYYLVEERIKHLPGFVYADENFLSSYSKRIYEKVKLLESKTTTKITHIYDIGGRDGFMLKDLAENGFQCTVFDPMPRGPYNKKIKKFNVWASQVDTKKSADLVLLCDVLSHCLDPKKEVERCKHLLKDDGFLYIEVPYDIGIFFRWLFIDRWLKRSLPVDILHFSYFSIRSILIMLEEAGFNKIHISFDFLPAKENVLLLNIIARKESNVTQSGIYKKYSQCFDLFHSNYLGIVFKQIMHKLFR